jgi:transglutaminase-like putative cysteine protease
MSAERQPSALAPLAALVMLAAAPGVVLATVVEQRHSLWAAGVGAVTGGLSVAAIHVGLTRRSGEAQRSPLLGGLVGAVVVACGLLAALIVSVVKPSVGDQSPVSAVVDALVHGWSSLAGSPVPAVAEPRVLVPIAVVSWAAAAAGAALAGRAKSTVVPLLPAAGAYLAASVAAGANPFAPVWVALSFVALAAFFLWARTDRSRSPSSRGMSDIATAGGLAALALGGGLLVGPQLLFGRDKKPFEPRDYMLPPAVPADAVNPLDLVGSRRLAGDQLMFTVRTSEPLGAQDLRLVALAHFDGARWTTAAPYERGGAELKGPERGGVPTRDVSAEITVAGLDGVWLPSIGDPTRVRGASVLVDPASGSLVAGSGSVTGAVYTIEAQLAEPAVERLSTMPIASTEEAIAALELPAAMPPLMREMADVATANATTPFVKAVRLAEYLQGNFTIDDTQAAGHSYGHLERQFLQAGSAAEEQFATMFATLGRAVGLPTRVVVGFNAGAAGADGAYPIVASDVSVWPEVLFEDVGWIQFVPAPRRDDDATQPESVGVNGSNVILKDPEEQPAPPVGGDVVLAPPEEVAVGGGGKASEANGAQQALVVAGAVAVLAAAAAAAVVLLKRRATARRRRGEPRDAVLGAWHDVLDRLTEVGVAEPRKMTVEELVYYSEPMSAALAGLYRPVNRALYDESEPSSADSEQAWRARDRFVHSLQRQASRRCRLRRALDPRPLVSSRSNGASS